ncbi:MAG: hypothetical protein K9N06_03335 [Candidatus Cloacimonetes bacterium]|nr:hypothetical protein [Candidatus Cloacimonadota bacterium]
MKKNNLNYILLLLLLIVSNLLGGNNFEVLEVTEDYVIIHFTLPDWDQETQEINGTEWQTINCAGAAYGNHAGEPDLPGFSGSVGIPPDGDINVTILSGSPVTIRDVNILPVYESYVREDELLYRFKENEVLYHSDSYFPFRIVEKGYTAMAGDRRFYSFLLHPFQYNAAGHKLRYYEELTLRIDISGDKSSFRGNTAGSILDKAGDEFLFNEQFARNWRQSRIPADEEILPRSDGVVTRYMLTIPEEGLYKVSYEFITSHLAAYETEYDAGYSWDNVDPRYLELSDRNGTVPINFYGDADGSFDAGDYFEFYADINHGETSWFDDYSTDNKLFLSLEDHLGSRMMVENGGLVESNTNNFTIPASFEQTLHIERQNLKEHLGAQTRYNINYFREDVWFWGSISAPDLIEFSFELEYPHASNIRKASARVCLMGLTYDDSLLYLPTPQNLHRAIVRINSALVNDIGSSGEWLGQREQIFENLGYGNTGSNSRILNTDLYQGENNLSVSLPNLVNQYEKVLLDYLDLTYWREYKTDSDILKFHKPILKPQGTPQPAGLYQFDLDGFSTEDVSVYKLGSSRFANLTVTSLSEEGIAPYRISFQDSVHSDNIEYLAITEALKKVPDSIVPDYPSQLKSSARGADYVIITVREFAAGATLFEEFWEGYDPGMQVDIVYVQDIFDEFNNGIRSVQSLKDFLEYTYNNWEPRPTHCLLLGEGLMDERDSSPYKWANKIPTKVLWFDARGATASDNWLGCISGNDIVADISISRLNITQAAQISTVVNKTEHYMTQPEFQDFWHSSLTLATGGKASEGNIFSKQSERIKKNSIPPEYRVTRVYCNTSGMPGSYSGNTTTLINAINDGTTYVQFMGHGASHQWDDYDLFDIYDVDNLNNENLFIASSMSCYGSAFFDNAGESCIGEALTLDAQGAIGHIGFTGFGYLHQDETYSRALLSALTNPALETLGEVIDYTKIRFSAETGGGIVMLSLLQGSALLGDPMVKVVRPELGTDITTNKYNYALNDSLILSAAVDSDIERGRFFLYDENDSQVSANEFYPFTYDAVNGEVNRITQIPGASVLPEGTYNRYVKFSGYSQGREILGITNFTIGLAGVYNLSWYPVEPTPADGIEVKADFFDPNGVDSVACHVKIYNSGVDPFNEAGTMSSHYYEEMVWNEEEAIYVLASPIPALSYNSSVRLEFIITDTTGASKTCTLLPGQSYFRITGVKFLLSDFSITAYENEPAVRLSVTNNGNRASEPCDLKLYNSNGYVLLDSLRIEGLGAGDQCWQYLKLPLLNGSYSFTIRVNEAQEFPGSYTLNTPDYQLQLFETGREEYSITTLDSNLVCTFPADLLPVDAIFKLEKTGTLTPLNQPDIEGIMLYSGDISSAYELSCLDSSVLMDTLGYYPAGKRVEMVFNYGSPATKTGIRSRDRLSVYRWNDKYNKWVFQSIGSNSSQQTITLQADRTGIYTIYDNQDEEIPSIDVNVEGQEFTFGGYVSESGIVSFLLGDRNGIDVIDHELSFYIDGEPVSSANYSINRSVGNLTSIPVKYQLLEIAEGIHYLQMSCRDFNGNSYSRELSFEVKADFDIIKVANYPNPVKSLTIDPINTGRTRFTYVLTDDADDVSIKVYTVSGRLVKSFKNLASSIGYHEYPYSNIGWDCRDEKGDVLANGIYFYKVTARKGSDSIERIQKMAILK